MINFVIANKLGSEKYQNKMSVIHALLCSKIKKKLL